jgi:hypothetical protein
MGLALLILRIGVVESGMFAAAVSKKVSRGNFFQLFTSWRRLRTYLAIICVGVPIWYVVGILYAFSPELGKALGLATPPNAARALFFAYAALAVGDITSGLVSQKLRSRKRALAIFLALTLLSIVAYFTLGGSSTTAFYAIVTFGGFAAGYWAVFVTTAAELFGTNLRATVATTTPNFVRGSLVLVAMAFAALKEPLGLLTAAAVVGAGVMVIAFTGLFALRETFGDDLDFHEEP